MKALLERGEWTFPRSLGSLNASGMKTIVSDPQQAHLITQAFLGSMCLRNDLSNSSSQARSDENRKEGARLATPRLLWLPFQPGLNDVR
jgi:hypothetical protein